MPSPMSKMMFFGRETRSVVTVGSGVSGVEVAFGDRATADLGVMMTTAASEEAAVTGSGVDVVIGTCGALHATARTTRVSAAQIIGI